MRQVLDAPASVTGEASVEEAAGGAPDEDVQRLAGRDRSGIGIGEGSIRLCLVVL